MLKTILVPLDGSPLAEAILPYAEALARASGERLRDGRLAVAVRVAWGAPEAVIGDAATDAAADLIALSTRGPGGLSRALFGSVADAVLRHAPVPVLLVPSRVSTAWHGKGEAQVLVPLDGSAFAEESLAPAAQVASLLGADLHLFRVVVPPEPPYAPSPVPHTPAPSASSSRRRSSPTGGRTDAGSSSGR
jgi:nucleotide-binding universal stress UspA family protein